MAAKEGLLVGAATLTGIALESTAVLGSTVLEPHRRRSHRALDMPDNLSKIMYTIIQPFTDGANWAFIHRHLHHQLADVNLGPFVQIADRFDFGQSEIYAEVPEYFDNLDLSAKNISLDRAVSIGRAARPLVAGWYEPYQTYSKEQDARIFDTKTPRYLYTNFRPEGDPRIDPDGPYRLEDVMWRLRDPHAPALHPNKVRGILKQGNNLYHVPERSPLFQEMMPDDLRRTEWEERVHEHHKALMKVFIYGNLALGAAGVTFSRGELRLANVVLGTVLGGTVAAGSGAVLLKGSELVNGMGHAGADPWGALFKGHLIPHADGTFATDGNTLLSWMTMDEAGLQGEHHRSPWLNAYTRRSGVLRAVVAPVGRLIEKMIESDLIFSQGPGFPGEQPRPDESHMSAKMIEIDRVKTTNQSQFAKAA